MTDKKDKFKTIVAETTSLFKDRGSKFLGYAYPIHSAADAKEKLQQVKKEHPKATHHCFAYRLGTDGLVFRASDDGEPNGSAGKPILGQIDSAQCSNVLVVIVRYYGGTMLGVQGLINAYKTATAEAFGAAEWIEKWITETVKITTDYTSLSEVLYLLKQAEAEILEQDLQLFCNVTAAIPKVNLEKYSELLLNIRGVELSKARA